MLFLLSEDLLPFCSGEGGPELDGIQNLLLSARQGRHAVSGKKLIFLALAKNQALSARERATALSLANRSAELPILEQAVNKKILVSAAPLRKITKKENSFSWEIDVKELKFKFLDSLVVLAENSIDAELFQHAALHHQISKKIRGVILRSAAQGGGGSQIDIELNSLLEKGTPVFAITDGDYLFPGMEPSIASSRCSGLIEEQKGLGWHYSLPTREVENIIPMNVLVNVADPKNSQTAYVSAQQMSSSSAKLGSCPCDFSCLKKGTTLSKVFKSENAGERSYWLSVANAIKHHRPRKFQECLELEGCGAEVCTCLLNYGFGENVLKQVKKWVSENAPHKALESFGVSEVWMNVGEMVFDASIAFKPANV